MNGSLAPLFRRLTYAAVMLLVLGCGAASSSPTPGSAGPTAGQSAATPGASGSTPASQAPTDDSAFDPSAVALSISAVVGGIDSPVDVASPEDGSGRLFVVEQAGRIRAVADGALLDEPFLDITDRVANGGERGLLGLAFHPDFPDDPRYFVNYTDLDGDTVVAEFGLDDGAADVTDAASERAILRFDQPYANHNGGGVVFGPDGMLYIATGDGGSGGDPHGNGQRLDTLLGKILRIDVDEPGDGQRPYGIPADNPFVDDPNARPEIWLTGMRNPWRIRFDSLTGDLWIGDVGQGSWEEIDVAPAGQGGLNFGWNRMEGTDCYQPPTGCDESGLELPVAQYGHGEGCAVIGGVVVRDADQPFLDGGYVFSDSCSGNVWLLAADGSGSREGVLAAGTGRSISSIASDEDGTVLATDRGSGELLAITGMAP